MPAHAHGSVLVLALAAALAPVAALAQQPGLTPTTAATGLPRPPEQLATVIEKAELSFRVDPAKKRLEGDATLRLRVSQQVQRLVVDLDRNYAIERVEVDGMPVDAARWRNPEGRMQVAPPRPLAAGGQAELRIRYGSKTKTLGLSTDMQKNNEVILILE